jgi:hypothetical protein
VKGFHVVTLDALRVDDERAFRAVPLYAELKRVVMDARCRFRVLPKRGARPPAWERALLLNWAFWGAEDGGGDVLVDERIAADVVCHVAWHTLAARAAPSTSADALFLGESIASAFDLFLVGELLRSGASSSFLETQVSAMAEVASGAGLSARGFEKLLARVADDPPRAFEDLRALLFDCGTRLVLAGDAEAALEVLASVDDHVFAPLLHHYALATWVLYARAYTPRKLGPQKKVRAIHDALRRAPVSLDWLATHWLVR